MLKTPWCSQPATEGMHVTSPFVIVAMANSPEQKTKHTVKSSDHQLANMSSPTINSQ